jgi:hypothetical protein
MASIVGATTKYKTGHKIILKSADKLPATSRKILIDHNYVPGTSIFKISSKPSKSVKFNIINLFGPQLSYATNNYPSIYLEDSRNNIVMIIGSESLINGSFNHHTKNAKSNTGELTKLKEDISMIMFENLIERNKILTEEQIINAIGNNKPFDSLYYESSLKQTKELKSFLKSNRGYKYERQSQNQTGNLYKLARKLSGKASDNWNPADIWMIKNTFKIDTLLDSKSITELNEKICIEYNKKNLIPISLKQIDNKQNANISIIDPGKIVSKNLEHDFSLLRGNLSETFNNFIMETTSGFAVRCGFKASATTLNVSLEGRFIKAGYQLGAVDAKQYSSYIMKEYSYVVRGGVNIKKDDYDKAMVELKALFTKHGKILSNTIENYNHAVELFNAADTLTKNRFANIISYFYSFLMLNKDQFENTMNFCYYSSKKISKDSCMYVLIDGK